MQRYRSTKRQLHPVDHVSNLKKSYANGIKGKFWFIDMNLSVYVHMFVMHCNGCILLSPIHWTAQKQPTLIQEIEMTENVLNFTSEAPTLTVSNYKRLHSIYILKASESLFYTKLFQCTCKQCLTWFCLKVISISFPT